MNIPASRQITKQIQSFPAGVLFSRSDFESLNISDERIDTELSRLYRSNQIERKRRGLYFIPKETPLGPSVISSEQLVKKILEENRRSDKKNFGTENKKINRIIPAGLTLFNVLGLSTQVPSRREYWSTFNILTKTVEVKKMRMELWANLTDYELMLFLAIGTLDRVSGEKTESVKNKISQLIASKQIPSKSSFLWPNEAETILEKM